MALAQRAALTAPHHAAPAGGARRATRAAAPARRGCAPLRAFNANDPATWSAAKGGVSQQVEAEEAPGFDVQQLSEAELTALLAAASPTPVPAQAARLAADRPPEDAAGAIAAGLRAFAAGDAAAALALFDASLQLPGSGAKRTKGAPRELSQGEEQAALYNAACCHARLGDAPAGIAALTAAVAAGFDDFDALRRDVDLAPLRAAPEWARFAVSFPPPAAGSFLSKLFGGR